MCDGSGRIQKFCGEFQRFSEAFRTAVAKPGIPRPASDSDWAAVDHAHDDGNEG